MEEKAVVGAEGQGIDVKDSEQAPVLIIEDVEEKPAKGIECNLCNIFDCCWKMPEAAIRHSDQSKATAAASQQSQRKPVEKAAIRRLPFPGVPVDPALVGLERLVT